MKILYKEKTAWEQKNMTFSIEKWLDNITKRLQDTFLERLLFIGLQGSYGRNETTKESDIDLVVILDELNFDDLKIYRSIIDNMQNKDKACGFISGKNEIQNWTKADLFQFFYDTKPIFGNLEKIIQPPKIDDIKKSIKTGCENLYHASVHSFVHSNNYKENLRNLYKMTFFILQAKHFIKTNNYIPTKKQLSTVLLGDDMEILNICIEKDKITSLDEKEIETLYKKLIKWCSNNI